MKFAFSSRACPDWDWATIAARAKEYGYDGVELAGGDGAGSSTDKLLQADPNELKSLFADQKIAIPCLSSAISMFGKKRADEQAADHARRLIELASLLGCGMVKVNDASVPPGHSREKARLALSDWLAPLGDFAAERNVMVLLENAISFRSAREIWAILERLQHPSIGCCWNILNAALIGESPEYVVPTLNSRIAYVHITDAKLTPTEMAFCELGQGDLQVREYLKRLRGVGYGGWISFEWDRTAMPELTAAEIILPAAIGKLRAWSKPQDARRTLKPGAEPVHQLTGKR